MILSAHQSFTLAVQSDIKVSPSTLAPIKTLLLSWFNLRKAQRRFCQAFWSRSCRNVDVYTANLRNKIVCQLKRLRIRRIARAGGRGGRAHVRTHPGHGHWHLTHVCLWVRCVLVFNISHCHPLNNIYITPSLCKINREISTELFHKCRGLKVRVLETNPIAFRANRCCRQALLVYYYYTLLPNWVIRCFPPVQTHIHTPCKHSCI